MSDTMPFLDMPEYGVSQTIEFDDAGGKVHIHSAYADVQPTLDYNTVKRNAGREYYARDKEMWRVASIPIGVQYEWLIKFGVDFGNVDHWPKVKQLLNSSDYRYLKTADIII